MTRILTVCLMFCAGALLAEVRSIDLYRPIYERNPFGVPPPDFDPTGNPLAKGGSASGVGAEAEIPLSEQQETLQRAVTATMIHIDPISRTPWLGFSDAGDGKSPKNYFIEQGTSEGGWKVVSVDVVEKKATLMKDGVEIEVVVGAAADKKSADGKRKGGTSLPGRSPLLGGANAGGSDGGLRSMQSLRQERREKEAAQQRLAEADRQAAAEAARKRQEELEAQQERERAEREAEREENKQQMQQLAEALEKRLAEARKQKTSQTESEEESDD